MHIESFSSLFVLMFLLVLVLGCVGPKSYKGAFKEVEETVHKHTFDSSIEDVWKATRIVLLSDGFKTKKQEEVEEESHKSLIGTKLFTEGKQTITLTINVSAEVLGEEKSILFASASQSVEEVHRKQEFMYFLIIPIPSGSTKTNLKVSNETIEDEKFYKRLYKNIEKELEKARKEGLE